MDITQRGVSFFSHKLFNPFDWALQVREVGNTQFGNFARA